MLPTISFLITLPLLRKAAEFTRTTPIKHRITVREQTLFLPQTPVERPVSQVMTELASVVRTQLNSFFGVEKIYNIKLDISNCKKCRSNSESAAVDSGDTADPVKTESVSSGRTISLKTPVKNDRNE